MIDISNPDSIKAIKDIQVLINDAAERKDKKALKWLQTEAYSTKTRKREDGTTYEVKKSITEIRAAYIKKFLNYKTKSEASKAKSKQAKKDKEKERLDEAFAKAFAALGDEE